MIWKDILANLDNIRTNIRLTNEFTKNPRSVIPASSPIVADLEKLLADIKSEQGTPVITVELDKNGKPVMTDDLKALFATVPAEMLEPAVKPRNPNEGTRIIRHNPVIGAKSNEDAAPKQRTVVLPRETPRVEHPVALEDADESTVAK